MAPQTQKAILVQTLNAPVILVHNHPIPIPQANQVLVKVSIAGLNPHDQKARDTGLLIADNLPAVLTNDVVGTVAELGENVSSVKVGDRVVYQPIGINKQLGRTNDSTQNGLQEYAVADVAFLAKIPEGVSDDEAATLPTNVIAPLVALFAELGFAVPWGEDEGGDRNGDKMLLVIGGGTNCGRFGVQLARLAGVGRIVVVGGDEEELKGYGATDVLDRFGGDEVSLERIRGVVGDELVYAYDAVNPPDKLTLGLMALSSYRKGVLARLLPNSPADTSKVVGKKAGFEVRDVFGMSHFHPELAEGFWKRLPGYLEDGSLRPTKFVAKYGLTAENVNETLDGYRDKKRMVKTHIHI